MYNTYDNINRHSQKVTSVFLDYREQPHWLECHMMVCGYILRAKLWRPLSCNTADHDVHHMWWQNVMQTYIHIYTRRLLQANPHVGLHGKSQDVPGHLGTKGICLTWDLHVRYPQCESTVKRGCHRCTHFTYNHVRPAWVQRGYHSWVAPASYLPKKSTTFKP